MSRTRYCEQRVGQTRQRVKEAKERRGAKKEASRRDDAIGGYEGGTIARLMSTPPSDTDTDTARYKDITHPERDPQQGKSGEQ